MPRPPRGKRVQDAASGSFVVVGRAPNGQPDPYFDNSRGVWVAPWRKPDGKIGRPTGRTRAEAEAKRNRYVAEAAKAERCGPLAEGFQADSTVAELTRWWLDTIARHRVRITTWATYDKQLRLVCEHIGNVPVRRLRPEQVASMVSKVVDVGSAARARSMLSAARARRSTCSDSRSGSRSMTGLPSFWRDGTSHTPVVSGRPFVHRRRARRRTCEAQPPALDAPNGPLARGKCRGVGDRSRV